MYDSQLRPRHRLLCSCLAFFSSFTNRNQVLNFRTTPMYLLRLWRLLWINPLQLMRLAQYILINQLEEFWKWWIAQSKPIKSYQCWLLLKLPWKRFLSANTVLRIECTAGAVESSMGGKPAHSVVQRPHSYKSSYCINAWSFADFCTTHFVIQNT